MNWGFNGIAGEYGLPFLVALLALGGFLAWRAAALVSPRLRIALLLLRLLSLALLAALLFNPGYWRHPTRTASGYWALIADQSASMAVADVQDDSRWNAALRLAARTSDIARHPERLRLFTFDDSLHPAEPGLLPERAPDGPSSRLDAALETLLQDRGRDLRGIVLLTDGRATDDFPDPQLAARALAFDIPVHAVCLGADVTIPDLELLLASRHRIAFPGRPQPFTARCSSRGLPPLRADVVLLDSAGRELSRSPVELPSDSDRPVELSISADQPGFQRYTIRLESPERELLTANNRAELGLSVMTNSVRILLAEGVPCWDSKFLVQYLRRQPNFEVTVLYRISPERSLVLRPDSEQALPGGPAEFPASEEALRHYDLVIFGHECRAFLDEPRLEALKNAMRHNGLGVIFARGKPYEGDFPALAEIEPLEWGPPLPGKVSFRPASDLLGDALPASDALLWHRFPLLRNARQAAAIKTFTDILAHGFPEGRDTDPLPILLARRQGRGMTLTLNAEGFWNWDFFPRDDRSREVYQNLWAQLILWVSSHADFLPGFDFALELSAARARPGESIGVRVRSRAPPGESPDNMEIIVKNNSAEIARLPLLRDDSSAGTLWNAVFTPAAPGLHQIELAGPRVPPGLSRALDVVPPPAENDILSANPDALQAFCNATGGRLVTPSEFDALVRELDEPRLDERADKAVWEPLWDRLPLLLALAAILGSEWFLRRRNGLL